MPNLKDICIDRDQKLIITIQGAESAHVSEQDVGNMYSYGDILDHLRGFDGVACIGFVAKDFSECGDLSSDLAALWWQENAGGIEDLDFLGADIPPFVSEHGDIDDWVSEAKQGRREYVAKRAA